MVSVVVGGGFVGGGFVWLDWGHGGLTSSHGCGSGTVEAVKGDVSIGPTAGAARTPHMWTWVVRLDDDPDGETLIGYAQTENQARADAGAVNQ